MNAEYWQSYYASHEQQPPSSFAESLELSGKTILDLGCGDGRDTTYFATNNAVLGIDQCAPVGNFFKQMYIEDFLTMDYSADVLYLRFLLHAVDANTASQILTWGAKNAQNVYIECRSDKSSPPDSTHERRLINGAQLLEECETIGFRVTYFAEEQGFAVRGTEDPYIIRMHLESKKHPS